MDDGGILHSFPGRKLSPIGDFILWSSRFLEKRMRVIILRQVPECDGGADREWNAYGSSESINLGG